MIDRHALLAAARKARENAYAPYSQFAVGAALLDINDSIHTGCNVENASYGLTCCAERVALFHAIATGARDFRAIAVVGGPAHDDALTPCVPCGICRQALSEFCDDELVVILTDRETTLGALLPDAFRLE